MSKSVYVVGGIGAVGCLMLSFMMQHLLKVHGERARSPIATELEEVCGDRLAKPIEASTMDVDGESTLVLQLQARPGVSGAEFARNATDLVWRRAHLWREVPERLRIQVRVAGSSAPPDIVDSRPPMLQRLHSGARDAVRGTQAAPAK